MHLRHYHLSIAIAFASRYKWDRRKSLPTDLDHRSIWHPMRMVCRATHQSLYGPMRTLNSQFLSKKIVNSYRYKFHIFSFHCGIVGNSITKQIYCRFDRNGNVYCFRFIVRWFTVALAPNCSLEYSLLFAFIVMKIALTRFSFLSIVAMQDKIIIFTLGRLRTNTRSGYCLHMGHHQKRLNQNSIKNY